MYLCACVCVYIFTVIFLSFTERAVNYRHFSASLPPPLVIHYRDCAHVCGCVRTYTHTPAFVDGLRIKIFRQHGPLRRLFLRFTFPLHGCFFLGYSGCARPLTHTDATTRVRTHTVTLTHAHVQVSNQRRLLSRGETRSATQKKWLLLLPEGEKRPSVPSPPSDHIRLPRGVVTLNPVA